MILKEVEKIYKVQGKPIHALDKLSLNIDEKNNGFYAIKGHSGSGKTTLIQILGLLEKVDNGIYELENQNVETLSEKNKANLRLHHFGFVFQDYHLMEHLKAYENVMVPMLLDKMDSKKRKEKAMTLLKKVGLQDRTMNYPKQLSGGEQQRVAIARALANDPDIILADEPTGNLDKENEKNILDLLKEISKTKCVIVVSHNDIIDQYANHVYILEKGRIQNEYDV